MSDSIQSERRETRYPWKLHVTLRCGRTAHTLYTSDVSYRGIFLCTDSPPLLHQLIAIEAALPPDNTIFLSHGMSVFALDESRKEKHRVPGAGIRFYAQSENDRESWNRFVLYVRENISENDMRVAQTARRRYPRMNVKFEVKPANIQELNTFFSRNLSTGGMLLETEQDLAIGQLLELSILHPITRKGFAIVSVVRRKHLQPPGLGLEFTGMDARKQEQFQKFIVEGIEAITEREKERKDQEIRIEVDDSATDIDFSPEED